MKNKIQHLVKNSYINGKLDQKVVSFISERLTRQELKEYIKLLKAEENKKLVYVTSGSELNDSDKRSINKLFANKQILYSVDEEMISGVKIVRDDVEYEINLEKIFNNVIQFLSKND